MADVVEQLTVIAESARPALDAVDAARESAYRLQRDVTRAAASTIRALHRRELAEAESLLGQARMLCDAMNAAARPAPSVACSGFVLDAQKEYAEAALLAAVVTDAVVPTPEQLGIDPAAWLNGLAEAGGELRRFVLDELQAGRFAQARATLGALTGLYDLLVTFDYPDAVIYGLKRRLDMVRAAVERTTGDVATTLREAALTAALERVEVALRG
jgi:translin